MKKNHYRTIELEIGRKVLGDAFDRIFEQNAPTVRRSSLRLRPGVTLPNEPASIRDRHQLITRVWTDSANVHEEIRQVATAGEFLFYMLKDNAKINHIALIKANGAGRNAQREVVDSKGSVPNIPEFLDNGLCTVLNLHAQNDESGAVRIFLTAYFELVKAWRLK